MGILRMLRQGLVSNYEIQLINPIAKFDKLSITSDTDQRVNNKGGVVMS